MTKGAIANACVFSRTMRIGEDSSAEQTDADVQAAQRLLQPGDAVCAPELVRLREALAHARDEPG